MRDWPPPDNWGSMLLSQFCAALVLAVFVVGVWVAFVCWLGDKVERRERRDERHCESGQAVIEWLLTLPILFAFMFLLTVTAWPSRLNAASAAAAQAARAAVEAPDPATGVDVGRQRALDVIAGHGFDPAAVSVTFSDPDPGRGGAVTATVTIPLPTLRFPLLGSWEGIDASRSSTARVPDYGDLR